MGLFGLLPMVPLRSTIGCGSYHPAGGVEEKSHGGVLRFVCWIWFPRASARGWKNAVPDGTPELLPARFIRLFVESRDVLPMVIEEDTFFNSISISVKENISLIQVAGLCIGSLIFP